MGFLDFFKTNDPKKTHPADPTLCFPHLSWERKENEGEDVWWLSCDECCQTFLETYRDIETGQLRCRFCAYWINIKYKAPGKWDHLEDRFRKLFYEKFPDADTPSEEHAQRAQEAKAADDAKWEAYWDERRQENLEKPHCPTCNSTDVQPISNAKRIASTAVMGIASSTIGKSYECKKCGYKW